MRLADIESQYRDVVTVSWRSYLLVPQPLDRTVDRFREYTRAWRRPAEEEPRAEFSEWTSDAAPPTHSLPAAIAGKAVERLAPELFPAFHLALFRAYFAQNRTVSDPEVLAAVAAEAGIGVDEFELLLADADGQLESEVRADHEQSRERGIGGVPGTLVNDELIIVGAVDSAVYHRVVEKLGGA